MRIDLSKLATNNLTLSWDSGATEQRLFVRETVGLYGCFVRTSTGWQLSNAGCEQLLLDGFSLRFGSTAIDLKSGGHLTELTGDLGLSEGTLVMDLDAQSLDAARLALTVGALRVEGKLDGRQVRLTIEGKNGRVEAKQASLTDAALHVGELHLRTPALTVDDLTVSWGAQGLRAEVGAASARELSAEHPASGAQLTELRLEQLLVAERAVTAKTLRAQQLTLDADIPRPPSERRPSSPPSAGDAPQAPALFDYQLLDGLSGHVHVDVAVDMGVPILGRRRATHQLRIELADGAFNYRQLEHSLAALEDSLLDFSVREGALVLERGVPLLSTRGHGKPLLTWQLDPQDLELAHQHRVRLAVLPRVRIVTAGSERSGAGSSGGSGLALNTMGLERIDIQVAMQAPASAPASLVRSLAFGRLRVRGAVRHEAGPVEPAGLLRAELEALALALEGLKLGASQVAGALQLDALHDAEISFEDLRPTRFRGELDGLTLLNVRYEPAQDRA